MAAMINVPENEIITRVLLFNQIRPVRYQNDRFIIRNTSVWHAAAVRICRVKITLAYSSNVLVVPGFIICTIAAPSRMTLVTTGASDLALESSSMQFSRSLLLPRRRFPPSDNDGG
ncbi:hypothetical protein GQR58_001994 [Nymphon striatum]|nr:hypothetical protein GQR58_001994 [Nymphon striatum]